MTRVRGAARGRIVAVFALAAVAPLFFDASGDVVNPCGPVTCYILCVMDRVGVRELRQNLSVYLRRVRRGETLEVTERGQPVATLQPIVDEDDALARLGRKLPLRRGAGNLAELPPPTKVEIDRPLSEVLEKLREDRI